MNEKVTMIGFIWGKEKQIDSRVYPANYIPPVAEAGTYSCPLFPTTEVID